MSKVLGILLIVIGALCLGWESLTFTTKEKVIDIGPLEATRDKKHRVPLPPIAGVIALAGGIVVLVSGKR